MKSTPIEVRLLGQKISLKTAGDPSRAREVVSFVNQRIQDVESNLKGGQAPHLVALLALLDLAEEYLSAKGRVEEHQAAVRERTRAFELALDSGTVPKS